MVPLCFKQTRNPDSDHQLPYIRVLGLGRGSMAVSRSEFPRAFRMQYSRTEHKAKGPYLNSA